MIMLKINTNLKEMKKYLDDTTLDMEQKRIEIQEKYEKKFNKIKEVITSYFS